MERMRDVEGVIGYDPWNEPMSGLRHVVSGWFERKILTEFYAECGRLRDEVDPMRLIFAEPTPLAALGAPSFLRLPEHDGFVYAPHIYDSGAITLGRYAPAVSTFPRTLVHHLEVAERMQVPLFIGEFGVLNWVRGGKQMLEHECRMFDRHFVSWSVWHYNPSEQDWNDENASFVEPDASARPWAEPLFRPYPAALAGHPDAWESKDGETWTLDYRATAGGTTELVVPGAWSASPEPEIDGAEHEWRGDRLLIRAPTGGRVRVALHR
jgi:endoglycosylceramidase